MNQKKRGFSLIELITVIILVSILSVMAVSRYSGQTINLDAQAQQFVDMVRYTQALAMSHGRAFKLTIALTNDSYVIDDGINIVASPTTGQNLTALTGGVLFGTLVNLPNNAIIFNSRGIPYVDYPPTTLLSSTATIPITEPNGTVVTISISPQTGRVIAQ